MKRILLIVCFVVVTAAVLSLPAMAADDAKEGKKAAPAEKKMKGDLIPHPESGDVKVMTPNYETETILVNDKTRIDATVKGKFEYMGQEAEYKLPKGEVTYVIIDGKPVATKITYGSSEKWTMTPPKPPED